MTMAARYRYAGSDPEEIDHIYDSETHENESKTWNVFKNPPREADSGSEVRRKYLEFCIKLLKVFTILFVFAVVLSAAIVSKGTTLFMTSQIRKNTTRPYCNKAINRNLKFTVSIPDEERVQWIWLLMFSYFVPELGTFFRSVRKCLFKDWKMRTNSKIHTNSKNEDMPEGKPSQIPKNEFLEFVSLFITEIGPAIGSAIFIFVVLSELDVIKGAMLTNALCFIPGIVAMFSRNDFSLYMVADIVCIVAQVSSFVIWPLLENEPILYMIPVSVVLISLGWWENFVSEKSLLPFISNLGKAKKEFQTKTYFLYAFIAPLKCLIFFCTALVIFQIREGDINFIFDKFEDAFKEHNIIIREVAPIITDSTDPDYSNAIATGRELAKFNSHMTGIWVWLINIVATYICYAFGKFSCKVMIQAVSCALPINLSVPVLLLGLITMCEIYRRDECSFTSTIPEYLFFVPPSLYFLQDFISHQHAWVWLCWLLSQAWITVHIWSPNCDKLASTEQLFIKPMYDAFFVDQSLALNRRRHEQPRYFHENDKAEISELDPSKEDLDSITRIYACATMWHETKEEMMEFLKSILRLDQDQCAHRIVRNVLELDLKNYYELETHIFFDDAFIRTSEDDNDPHVNKYVKTLVSTIDEAAGKVLGTHVKVRPPKIYPTPYGGRLVWTLPGRTKMIAHLKDEKKIRKKKRWSQVMYMYYLLGLRLQANEDLSYDSKVLRSQNTYILALDGDIDFQPEALHLLVDYMKRNKSLGAACGRIHPIGSGGMAWYQMFEYAVGHWMQKATEHVIGCVLCSPGCFSLFRGKALMDESVMCKYATESSEAKHYVQYDQGEDRWLCTLLLQRGYRVEYSAASDAFTHCPEGFNEFYNQRRRWMPSTMANILDLLMDYEHTVKVNENISMLYIGYQIILLIGTVLGPGTIFLMLVGAFVAAFGLDQWSSFYWNLAPIAIFVVVCATCSSDIQLFFAGLISAIYGLIMMAVFVGVMLQISQDGILAPSSLFFFCIAGEFIIAAFLHPQEFNCLKYGVIYYVTVPSMYMLLVIYAVFNMNDVSWGTREVTAEQKGNDKNENESKEEPKKKEDKNKILSFLGANAEDNEGAWEFSINKLFKCMFCTYKGNDKENEQLRKIQEAIRNDLDKKIDTILRIRHPEVREPINEVTTYIEGSEATIKKNSSQTDNFQNKQEDNLSSPCDEVMENSWFYDDVLIEGEVHFLHGKEEKFWSELIEEYLQPIEYDTKKKDEMKKDLKNLRDKMVFSFFMLNSLFVLVVFLLTLKKDILHLNWPIEPKVNFTYVKPKNEIEVYITYLQLEPIGFVFLIFFALLLVIQFIAMIIHRFGTFSQIMTKTNLEFNLFKRDIDDFTIDELEARDPLKIVKDLQKLKGINNEDEEEPDQPVDVRNTVSNLTQKPRTTTGPIYDTEKAFHTRIQQIAKRKDSIPDSDRRKKSVAFVQRRMTKTKKRQSRVSRSMLQMSQDDQSIIFNETTEPDVEI